MNKITVALASDHAGFALKEELKTEITRLGLDYLDLGTNSSDSVDYPDFGRAIADALIEGRADRGVIVCGTGIGISIAANRVNGVRAAVCHDATTARLAREHNDANVLALGARIVGTEVAKDCLHAFLSATFDGGERHQRRVDKLG
ncbi:MAG: ribose 5-phosphate isomerase B [Alphaproteobacteria bacterium]|nr:ribose 5-phosphate isomerase B [Alphaproteobacteria bacterium]MCZ6592193.1 ribose 5-phosphate isomerase B [Alphaproteobacteria bacterium]MCZ6839146.1 ribose 5-phosphate isomerase B [Alphaproteobacteria bacterium]MCZ6846454.1 ribose 5-phosphate isomerase B [Alphaproteobacteria bacterium]